MRRTLLGIAVLTGFVFMGCSLTDSVEEAANVVNVKFSSAGWSQPSVESPSTADVIAALVPHYGRGLSLSDFKLDVTYNVQADNSGNSGTAAFGTSLARPVLHFYVGDTSKTATAWNDTIEPFSIPGGVVDTLHFTTSIPFSWIKTNAPGFADSVLEGKSIPYRLTASLAFQLTTPLGSVSTGTSELDLVGGGVATRPDAVVSYLSSILKLLQ